jgi:hypothetical protein
MNTWLVLGLLLALGIIVGNMMLLKYSAKMKFGKPQDLNSDTQINDQKPDEQDPK